jgi:hypothetical protein
MYVLAAVYSRSFERGRLFGVQMFNSSVKASLKE